MIGKNLAHYEITALLGKGGMGEVYRARDTKLGRDVAIKILPTELSGDPERAARFDREARTLASLQHPAVASIYGYEEVDSTRFLVMELVEGQDLSVRLGKGQLPLDEIKRIGLQIATGLEAAHERGIVHRDLKPGNIMLNDAGEAKILDFGLARAWFGDMGDADMENSPTITAAMTQAGTILGTAAYMSPEQARGRNVDRRADIWAFGAILWEMVTGQRLFEGETVSDTLAAVLRAEPEWDLLPAHEAPQLCHLIERCLVRDPRQRLRDIGEARILLQDGTESSILMRATVGSDEARHPSRTGWFVAVAMALVAAVTGTMLLTRGPERTLSQTTLGLPKDEAQNLTGSSWSCFQFSPDGHSIVYVGGRPGALFIRDIDSFRSTKIADTDGALLPMFSPDGRWIAYTAQSKLWKIAVSGGAPVEICDAAVGPGLAWGDGELYFCRTNGGGLWAVSENGGEPRPISTPDEARDETSHRWPQVLPGGRHLLMTIKTARITTFDDASIGLLSLDSGDVTVLLTGGCNPRYVPTGHLVYGRGTRLFAVPFDLETLSIQGTPTAVVDDVHISDITGSAHYVLSPQGHMAYVPAMTDFWDYELVWLQKTGLVSPVDIEQRRAFEVDLAPDGRRFAASAPAANDKIRVYDLERKTTSLLTSTPGNDRRPLWSPDGKSIVYRNDRDGSPDLYQIAADGSAPAVQLLASDTDDSPTSWAPDGSRMLFTRTDPDGGSSIWIMNMDGEHEVEPFVQASQGDGDAVFSPDGNWVAYVSQSAGEADVYVRPYPGPGNPIRVSRSGGFRPLWSPEGASLFYRGGDAMYEAPIDRSDGLRVGDPVELFTMEEGMRRPVARASLAPDGKRFLAARFNLDAEQSQIRVIFDWTKRLNEIASAR